MTSLSASPTGSRHPRRWLFNRYLVCIALVAALVGGAAAAVNSIIDPLWFWRGNQITGRPCLGSWASYGLGSMNDNLPGYVVLTSGRGSSGGWGETVVLSGVPGDAFGPALALGAGGDGVAAWAFVPDVDRAGWVQARYLHVG